MCLAVPAQIVDIHDDQATVDMHGNRVAVSTALVPNVTPGDWVLLHAGFAIQKLSPTEAHETWSVLADLEPPAPPHSSHLHQQPHRRCRMTRRRSTAAKPSPANTQANLRAQVDRSLHRLHAAANAVDRPITFMEVCGTHTMSAFRSGLHSLMPDNVTLLSGPGCPVCVTAQGDIDQLIALVMDRDVTLCTYGDMLRVPGRNGSLERARSRGADVRVVYSTLDAVRLAAQTPDRQVVFGAVGFETTAPATAIAVLEAEQQKLDNFSVLVSHKRVVPAMLALLESDDQPAALDGFLCPGHVSVIIGANAYKPIVQRHNIPCVIGGFEEALISDALASLAEQVRDGQCKLVNQYPEAVTPGGNRVALACIDGVFKTADVKWRGLGTIPNSGHVLRSSLQHFDAAHRFALPEPVDRELGNCLCGQVIAGRATPDQCKLFASSCTPISPVGPCMVSSEGTCQAWFKYQRGQKLAPNTAQQPVNLTTQANGGAS